MAHQELRESQLGITDTPLGSTNAAINQDNVQAIANLATVTDHDCAVVSTLSTTNVSLTLSFTKASSDLVDAFKISLFSQKDLVNLKSHQSLPLGIVAQPTRITVSRVNIHLFIQVWSVQSPALASKLLPPKSTL